MEDTENLKTVVETLLQKNQIHYFIHSMAVSDYTVDYVTTLEKLVNSIKNSQIGAQGVLPKCDNVICENKISSNEDNLVIKLKRTPKIISMIKQLSPNTKLIGFKLLDGVEEQELINVAKKLKDKNNCDFVVANDLSNIRKGNHKAFIIRKDNSFVEANGKEDIAEKLAKEMFGD